MSASTPTRPTALVTGGVRGLGLAAARALAAAGYQVHVSWRSSSAQAAELEAEFPGRVHRADLESEAAARALVATVLELDGRLDALVHAVGDYAHGPLEGVAPAELRALLVSNVETAFNALSAARAELRQSRGCAVLFGCAGLDGLRAKRQSAAYAAAKSALLVLARSSAVEEGAHGVRVNVVSPGIVPHEHAHDATLDPKRLAGVPLGRAGAPAEVGAAVAWLCSDAARYVTGVDLAVAGGYML